MSEEDDITTDARAARATSRDGQSNTSDAPVAEALSDTRESRRERRRQRRELKKNPFAAVGISEGEEGAEDALAAEKAFNKKLPRSAKLAIILAFIVIFFVSFALGRYSFTPVEWFTTFYNHFFNPPSPLDYAAYSADHAMFSIRLPRICMVILVGAALAISGASYQGMFKNPLVSPDILGASAGASFGASIALVCGMGGIWIQLLAFAGGMIAVGMAVWLNKLVKYDPVLGLVLGGILVSTLFQSGTSLLKYMADANDTLPELTFWLMGTFSHVEGSDLAAVVIPMIAGFALLLLESWKLNVLSFGDEEARSMGVNTRLVRLVVIFASTLIVSCSIAVTGIVGWVGLVIPHLARAIVGPNYRVLLPTSMLIGASYLLVVDDIARVVSSVEIPIGILTAILGVPFFVVIFRHNMRGWK